MKKKGNILIIDDNEAMLVSLRMLLKNVCEDVQTSTNPNAIPTLMRRKRPDVVLLDMNFGRGINNGNEGMFWLKEIKRLEPDVAVVLFTAYADIVPLLESVVQREELNAEFVLATVLVAFRISGGETVFNDGEYIFTTSGIVDKEVVKIFRFNCIGIQFNYLIGTADGICIEILSACNLDSHFLKRL